MPKNIIPYSPGYDAASLHGDQGERPWIVVDTIQSYITEKFSG